MSSSNCCFLTCIQISQEAGQVVRYSHPFQNFPQFIVIHTIKCFGIVDKAELDAFLKLSCFFDDPADVGNLISGSSTFCKSSLNIWEFRVHVLLKSVLENFEHHFASVWDVFNCSVVWAFFGTASLDSGIKTDLFQSCGPCSVFQIYCHIQCSTFTASSLRIGIAQLELLHLHLLCSKWLLPKAHLTSHSWMSGSRCDWSHHHDHLGHEDLFRTILLCILATSS